MLIREILGVALGAIRANALRSMLTTLGIIIGVGAVIAMVALGDGAQKQVEDQIASMGTNVLTIRAGQQMMHGRADGDSRLFVEDAEALRDRSAGTLIISPEISSRMQVSYLRWNASDEVRGVWPEYFDMNNFAIAEGRIFDMGEVQGRRRVAVLGSEVPEQLGTPASLLLGRTIQIRGIAFQVVGVLREKGSMGHLSPDDDLYIPQSTAQYRVMGGRDRLGAIYAQVTEASNMDAAFLLIDQVVRREHKIPPGEAADFNISNSVDLIQTFNEANQTFALLLAGIAAVSLMVGGIGIMNIMLVSVTERTREIGVRKALGATRANVRLQFLAEALVLCFLGGLLGVLAGFGSARVMSDVWGWQTAVRPDTVFIALGVSLAIGLFFGIWPAHRAAKLDPIAALRYE